MSDYPEQNPQGPNQNPNGQPWDGQVPAQNWNQPQASNPVGAPGTAGGLQSNPSTDPYATAPGSTQGAANAYPGQSNPNATSQDPYAAANPGYATQAPYGQQVPDPSAFGYAPNPYGQPYQPPLAGWGKRAQGWLLDWFVPSLLLNGLIMALVPSARINTDPAVNDYGQNNNWVSLVVFLITAVALAFLNKDGQTPGRRWAGTRLVDQNGQPVQAGGPSLSRYLLHILDDFCFLGWLWPLWDSKRQTFADKIAKTYVVRDETPRH